MRLTQEQFKSLIANRKIVSANKTRHKIPPKKLAGMMNENEKRYARHLDQLKANGEIYEWLYESFKLKVGDKCWLIPDFLVVYNDKIALHDAKGRKTKTRKSGEKISSYWAEADAVIKIKAIAEKFWFFEVAVVYQEKDGSWKKEVIGGNE